MLPPPPQEPRALSGRARPAATGNRTRGSARLRTLPLQLTGQCQPPREEEDHGGHCLHPQASPPPCHPPAEPTSPRSQQEGRAPTHTAEKVSEVAHEAATLPDSPTTSTWSNTRKNCPSKTGKIGKNGPSRPMSREACGRGGEWRRGIRKSPASPGPGCETPMGSGRRPPWPPSGQGSVLLMGVGGVTFDWSGNYHPACLVAKNTEAEAPS